MSRRTRVLVGLLKGCRTTVGPLGEVMLSTRLPDGRCFRVCGEKPHRGCAPAAEMAKMLAWTSGAGTLLR